jgi:hypothetical protein
MKRLALVLAVTLTACSGSSTGGDPATCAETGCAAGTHCDVGAGGCIPDGTGCMTTGCLAGWTCNPVSGLCEADTVCVPEACPAGTWCNGWWSECISDPYCVSASDCPPGQSCSAANRCYDPLATACTDLRDCTGGRLCQTSTGTCVATMTCSVSTPCPKGAECVGGFCAALPAGECNRQIDCFQAGDQCVSGLCVGCATTGAACTGALETCDTGTNTCRTCANGGECPVGLVCTTDGCAECASDADCAAYPNRPICVKRTGEGQADAAGRCQECNPRVIPDTCGATAGCGDYGEYCVPNATCDSDAVCSGATPYCSAIPGGAAHCGRCAVDSDCPTGRDGAPQACRFGECHVLPPGDRCSEPIELGAVTTRKDFLVSLAGFWWEDADASWDQHDAFYRFTTSSEADVVIDGRTALAWGSGRFRLFRDGCAARVGEHYFGTLSYNPPYSLYHPAWTLHLPAGTWVLSVGGYADTVHAVSIEVTPRALAEGLGCTTPRPIVQSATGSTVTGSTDGLLFGQGDYCAAEVWWTPSLTAVYSLDLAAPSYVSLLATPVDATLVLDLDVKDDCATEAPRDTATCNGDAGVAVARTFSPLPAGLHYVVVGAERNTTGSYRLDAVVVPWSTNDACADAKALAFQAGAAVETGTVGANTSTPSGCVCGNQLCGNDVFYRFTTTGEQALTVSAAGDGTWRPAVSVRRACDATPPVACALAASTAVPAETFTDILPAGDWLVQVGSMSGAGGPFTLQVALAPPLYPDASNDLCSAAAVLTANSPVTGDTRGAQDDVSGTCNGSVTGAGKDLAYAFTAPSRGLFHPTVTPATTALLPVLRARADCAATSELACDSPTTAGWTAWLPSLELQGGDSVVLWVDGRDGSAGPYTLDPQFEPAPGNDTCAGATLLGTSTLTSSLLTSFTDGACAGAELNDVFFRVDTASRSTVTVTVTPESWVRTAVAYYGTTCDGLCDSSAFGSTGGAVSLSATYNGSGYFAVSSADGSRGGFQISAQVR